MNHDILRPYYLIALWSFAYWRELSRRFDHADRIAEPDPEGDGALLVWEGEGGRAVTGAKSVASEMSVKK